jgi:PIN domain nuclease of toxin-antitoxin system
MSSIVADTHTAIWYVDAPTELSARATAALDAAASTNGEYIYISAITLVEIQYLVEKNRIDKAVQLQILQEIEDLSPRVLVYPLNTDVAAQLANIPRNEVPDMPDRIIAATALLLGLPLVSCDSHIRKLTGIDVVW